VGCPKWGEKGLIRLTLPWLYPPQPNLVLFTDLAFLRTVGDNNPIYWWSFGVGVEVRGGIGVEVVIIQLPASIISEPKISS
jgi:hypothetical protein